MPNGWLGLQLGKAIYIHCFHVEMADSNLPQMLQRVKAQGASMTTPQKPVPASTAVPTSSSSNGANAEILDYLKKIMQQGEATSKQLDKLQTQHFELSVQVKKIQGQLDATLKKQ